MSLITTVSHSKSAALTRVLDLIPRGYTYYTAGQVEAKKLTKLIRKFHERYGVCCSPAERITRKKHGLSNALLGLYWPADKALLQGLLEPSSLRESLPRIEWLLLVTHGQGPVWSEEKLKPFTDKPYFVWLDYELVRHPARGQTRWTWRRTKPEMENLYDLLSEQLKRRQYRGVEDTLIRLSRQPGFAGVRAQSQQLFGFARQRGYTQEFPKLFFMEKISHGTALIIQ